LELSALRRQLAELAEGGKKRSVLPFGVAAIDGHLPWSGLPLGALHEIEGGPAEDGEGAVSAAFLAGILARLVPERPVLWCLAEADLYVPGLLLSGLAPHRLILAQANQDRDILWAMEEGLRCRALAAVVGETKALPALAGRRLQLAAETSGVTGFVLHRRRRAPMASPAVTQWRVATLPGSLAAGEPGVGQPLWRVELLRCRGGMPASWIVEACDATDHISLSAALVDRAIPDKKHAVG
jgi:protein ImuA